MLSSESGGALLAAIGTSNDPTAALAGIAAAGKGKASVSEAQAERAGRDFEAMLLGAMLGEMFGESIGTDAFGDEESGDIYKGLMMEQYGKQIAQAGGIGIADYVKRELLKTQEV